MGSIPPAFPAPRIPQNHIPEAPAQDADQYRPEQGPCPADLPTPAEQPRPADFNCPNCGRG